MLQKSRALARRVGTASLAISLALWGCGLAPVPLNEPKETTEREPATTVVETEPTNVGDLKGESYMLTDMSADEGMGYYEQPELNTEEYASVEESGFVSTTSSPLSTVSADVDTASYANVRRMLRAGYSVAGNAAASGVSDPSVEEQDWYYYETNKVIPKGAVRIEEMLNYFDYDYAVPQEGEGFAVTARVGACPWNADTQLLVLGFATPHESPTVQEKGSNLVFLIDVSGSMDDADKLPLLQGAFGKLVETLGPNDVISIVTYSGEEEVVLEGESGENHQAIMRAIRGLKASGSTNGEAGLRMAYDIARKNFIEGGVNRIVMASDGDLNVGMTSESDLHDFVEKERTGGVYLSVLGFGAGNYKDTKMETLADHGNGSYHYIDCEDEAQRVFGQRLTANLVPFANDVKVQVEFNPSQIKGYRLIGYENRTMAAEDFKDDKKDAGEVGPESQFTVAYEVVRTDSPMQIESPDLKYGKETATASSSDWLTAKLRYAPLGGGDVREVEKVVTEQDWSADPGDDWRLSAAVTEFGMLLRDSSFKGTSSFDGIKTLVGSAGDAQRTEFLELVDLAQKN